MADTVRLGNPQLVPNGGNPGGSFANDTYTSTGTVPNPGGTVFGAANPCGADSNTGSSCSATFTFNFTAYSNVTSASFTLGLLGLDSADPGNQVGAFKLTTGTGFDMTADFNALSEGVDISGRQNCTVNGVNLTRCPEYNIYTINITDPGALALLSGGTATFTFTMAGTGLNAFGAATTNNGATLDFAEFDINGDNGGGGGGTPTPEPSTIVLLFSGVGALAGIKRRLS
jgi:hypothetical protein